MSVSILNEGVRKSEWPPRKRKGYRQKCRARRVRRMRRDPVRRHGVRRPLTFIELLKLTRKVYSSDLFLKVLPVVGLEKT